VRSRNHPDFAIMFSALALLCIGIIMVFSSSSVWAYYKHKDSFYFLKRQLLWAILGFISMIFFMNYDYWKIKRHEKHIIFIMLFLLIIVLIPGIGIVINEARRWIGIGSLTFQPSELCQIGHDYISFIWFGEER
jgi:cell division protein FtsW